MSELEKQCKQCGAYYYEPSTLERATSYCDGCAQDLVVSLEQRIKELERDKQRIDWLEQQFVTVRTPLVYGSRECFIANADADHEFSRPSNLRKAIDAAINGVKDA